MAESYPLQTPNTDIASIHFVAKNAVSVSTSPFTFSQQVYRHQGQGWEVDVSLPPMKRERAEEWVAFLLRLRGQYGTFRLSDPSGLTPRGSASTNPGTPVVNGINQVGDYLNIDGLPINATGYLKAGDYIQLGSGATSSLHKVLEDVNSNASGQATLNLFPAMRKAPTDGSLLIVNNAEGVFRLTSNETSWDINSITVYGISFGAVEVI